MNQKVSPWQIVFYVSLSVFMLWLILKMTGVINTPVLLEYGLPITSLVFAFLAHYQHIIGTINKLAIGLAQLNVKVDHIDKDVDVLKSDVRVLKDDVSVLKQRTAHL